MIVGFIFTRTRAVSQRRLQIALLSATGVVLVALLVIPVFTVLPAYVV